MWWLEFVVLAIRMAAQTMLRVWRRRKQTCPRQLGQLVGQVNLGQIDGKNMVKLRSES